MIGQNTTGKGNGYIAYDEEVRAKVFADELGNQMKYSYDENRCMICIEKGGGSMRGTIRRKQAADRVNGQAWRFYENGV